MARVLLLLILFKSNRIVSYRMKGKRENSLTADYVFAVFVIFNLEIFANSSMVQFFSVRYGWRFNLFSLGMRGMGRVC